MGNIKPEKTQVYKNRLLFGFFLCISSLCWMPREMAVPFLVVIGISAWLYFKTTAQKTIHWQFIFGGLLLISCFSQPLLSNDVYRFFWDGELISMGINPHDFKPNELINSSTFSAPHLHELYRGMGQLSQENYSCYPFMNQLFSLIPAVASNHFQVQLIILKLLFTFSFYGGYKALLVIIDRLQISNTTVWIIALHPLFFLETVVNFHFEGVMVSFVIMAIAACMQHRYWLTAILLGISIQFKLIPLILLPFFIPMIGFWRSAWIGAIVLVFVGATSMVFINFNNWEHFTQSLALYYGQFEFNSSIYSLYLSFGKWRYGFYPTSNYSQYLSEIAVAFIIVCAWIAPSKNDWQTFFRRLTWAFTGYYLLATTVHPWYLILPLVFGVLAGYRFTIYWGFLLFLTYLFYDDFMMKYYSLFKWLEYGILLVFIGLDIFRVHCKTR